MKKFNFPNELIRDQDFKRYGAKNHSIFKKSNTAFKVFSIFTLLLLSLFGIQLFTNTKSSTARPSIEPKLNTNPRQSNTETLEDIELLETRSEIQNEKQAENLILPICTKTAVQHEGTFAFSCITDDSTSIYYEFFEDTYDLNALSQNYELTQLVEKPYISIRTGIVEYKNRLLAINMQEKSLLDINTTIPQEKILKWYKKSIENQQINQ